MTKRWEIVATNIETLQTEHLFTWTCDPNDGIAVARRTAVKFGRANELMNYRAVPVRVARPMQLTG